MAAEAAQQQHQQQPQQQRQRQRQRQLKVKGAGGISKEAEGWRLGSSIRKRNRNPEVW